MKLIELKNKIDFICDRCENPKDIDVCITLVEPSVGGRAKVGVQSVNLGFDWEKNQLRIEPDKEIVRKGRDLQTVIPIKERFSFDKTCKVFRCPICDGHLNKNDRYCKFCGQRLKE